MSETTPAINSLLRFGVKSENLGGIFSEVKRLSAKGFIEIKHIARNTQYPDLVDVSISLGVLGEKVTTKLTIFLPEAELSEALINQIDDIENESLAKIKEMGLYPGKKLDVLADTFCSGLVHCAYSPQFLDTNGARVEGFTSRQIYLLCLWIMLLFANDEDRDVFSVFETKLQVQQDNANIIKIFGQQVSPEGLSKKSLGMLNVIENIKDELKVDALPLFFIKTLNQYLASTLEEVRHAYYLLQPNEGVLEVIKERSSGSAHAIAAGAALKGLNRDALIENETLDEISTYIARAVESHNDVNSHPKETRQRIKKLFQILSMLDAEWESISGYIKDTIPTDQISDTDHQFLVNFYRKAYEKVMALNQDTASSKDVILNLLQLVSSFNRVDFYMYQGDSLQESYDKTAKRGNDMILNARESIKTFQDDVRSGMMVIPDYFDGKNDLFLSQARQYISLNIGWGAQNVWEWVAKRYNEGLPNVSGQRYVDLLQHIQTQLG